MDDPNPQPTLVSLFAGAGGMDIGLERAGWRTAIATDIDADCIGTLEASRAASIAIPGSDGATYLDGCQVLRADVRDLCASDLRPARAPLNWRPALLAGGPPCQPWSSAGLQRGLNDERSLLIDHMIRLTGELRPRFVLFENVRGLVTAIGPSGRPGEMLALIKHTFEDLGYATAFATLNAADYGAPQRRVRLYMFASEGHPLPAFPQHTHARGGPGDGCGPRAWTSLREFLRLLPAVDPADVVAPRAEQKRLLEALAPGTGIRTPGKVVSNRPGGHWGYRQDGFLADLDLPSRTIRAAATPDWVRLPDGTHRRLTWQECAALQGFPPSWRFQGKRTSIFRQIGNAVQADVVELLGRALRASLALPLGQSPVSADLPEEFHRRIRYTEAEHRVNGAHRVRVRVARPGAALGVHRGGTVDAIPVRGWQATRDAMRATASPAGSCSQIRTMVQPASRRSWSV